MSVPLPPTSSAGSAPCLPASELHERWFNDEVHAHDRQLKAYLRNSFPAVRDVEDLVQESYLRVWQRQLQKPIAEVSGSVQASVRGFLFRVAQRLALDALRRERISPIARVTDFPISSVVDDGPGAADAACTAQEIEILMEAIDALPRRCREIVILRKLQGVSQKDIASRLGLSEQTVQVQASRGLRKCDQFLRRRGITRGGA